MITKTSNKEAYNAIRSVLDTDKYRHEFAHFFEGTIKAIGKNEVIQIHRVIVLGILDPTYGDKNKNNKRPECPVTGPNKINQAKATYKIAMIKYIAGFGIHLTENAPCNYPPAILEALANYCEKKTITNSSINCKKSEKIDNYT